MVDAVVDSHYVALLPLLPDDLELGALIAVPAELPSEAGASYRRALHALEIATRFDRTGVIHLAGLGAMPLLVFDADTAHHLADVHLATLRERGAAGAAIVDTVAAFLRHDRRVDDTAAALHLHRNIVRNRVRRFGSLTGLDLDRTDDLVLAWWLLNRR